VEAAVKDFAVATLSVFALMIALPSLILATLVFALFLEMELDVVLKPKLTLVTTTTFAPMNTVLETNVSEAPSYVLIDLVSRRVVILQKAASTLLKVFKRFSKKKNDFRHFDNVIWKSKLFFSLSRYQSLH
jgi:hypothetical protein